jgi:hypothetical protein
MAAAFDYVLEPIRDGAEFRLHSAAIKNLFSWQLPPQNNRCPRVCDDLSTNTRSQPNLSPRGRLSLWRSRVTKDGQSWFCRPGR